jgi:hypothetical protein
MAMREPNATMSSLRAGRRRLRGFLTTGLLVQAVACASATVGDLGNHDAAAPDATGNGGNSTGGSGGKGGSGGAGGTSTSTAGICDPFTNAGCDSGKKCTALQTGSTLTLGCGTKGGGAENASCTQTAPAGTQTGDDCGDGLACFGAPATCHRMCLATGTANGCPGTEICSLEAPGLSTVKFCRATVSCLPLEQTGCASGEACYFSATGALCAQAGATNPGGNCASANDCARGSTCLMVGSTGTCSSFCSTASGGTPVCSGAGTGGSTCAALGGPSDEANLGSCR